MIAELFTNYTIRNIALGTLILGIVSGVLGSFAVLRRQSLLGDTLSHAALPGVCLAFILSGESKSSAVLLLGAAVAGAIGAILLTITVRNTRIKEDAAQGVVLSAFFGLGFVILSILRQSGGSGQAGLDKFLFGSAASLVQSDVEVIALIGGVSLLITLLLYKEFKLLSFDPEFMATLGFGVRWLDIGLTLLIVLSIVIGLQTVGVVLMSAMLIAPGAAARQWTNRLGRMIMLASIFGAVSGVSGALISASAERIPTGPAIVLVLTTLTIGSLLFGRERGIIWSAFRARQARTAILADLRAAHIQGSPAARKVDTVTQPSAAGELS